MCLYELQRAFEYPDRLYEGMNGKCRRLLKNWYEGASCQMKVKEGISEPFRIGRGVKQGSVLSPALFLLIMDPLLKQLEKSGIGLSVNQEVSSMPMTLGPWSPILIHSHLKC